MVTNNECYIISTPKSPVGPLNFPPYLKQLGARQKEQSRDNNTRMLLINSTDDSGWHFQNKTRHLVKLNGLNYDKGVILFKHIFCFLLFKGNK